MFSSWVLKDLGWWIEVVSVPLEWRSLCLGMPSAELSFPLEVLVYDCVLSLHCLPQLFIKEKLKKQPSRWNNLLTFCYIYFVSTHYLLCLYDNLGRLSNLELSVIYLIFTFLKKSFKRATKRVREGKNG